MIIQWDAFTPGHALAGGVLIGLCAGLRALLNDRLADISGIVGGLFDAIGDRAWRLLFLAGPFTAAMLAGMGLFAVLEQRRRRSAQSPPGSAVA